MHSTHNLTHDLHMSSYPEYHIHTAKRISIQRVKERSVRPPTIVGLDGAWWARDSTAQITSTKFNSTPYDHTTPPPSPQTSFRPHTQGVSPLLNKHLNRHTSPPAAYQHTSQPPTPTSPRVARDDLDFTFKKNGTFSDARTFFIDSQHSVPPDIQQRECDGPRSPSLTDREETEPDQILRQIQRRDIIKSVASVSGAPTKPVSSTLAPATKPKASTKAKPMIVTTSGRRRRLPPQKIFNMSFSFNGPSRQRPTQHTPQVSPRASISSDSNSSTTSSEPPKRQRIDSYGPKPEELNNIEGIDTSLANIIFTSTEAHPGQLVDFSSPDDSAQQHSDSETYHNFLAGSKRPVSSHAEYCGIDQSKNLVISHPKVERLSKEARILGLTVDVNTARTGSICTLQRSPRTKRKTRLFLTPSPSNSNISESMTSSSGPTSDPNMERFLTHVRASQEARLKKGEGVFADEESGWMTSGPL